MYNHKERRQMEKKLGLLEEYHNMSEAGKAEVRRKKQQAGEQIHLRNLQENENQRIEAEAASYASQLQSWIKSGKTYEEAEAIMKKNADAVEKRLLKLAARKERQNASLKKK